MAVAVDVPRHDPPVVRVGDGVGRPTSPSRQPEPQERPLAWRCRSSPSSSKSARTRSFAAVAGSGGPVGRGEGVAVPEQHRHVDRAGAAFPAVAHDEVARVVVVQPPRCDHDRRLPRLGIGSSALNAPPSSWIRTVTVSSPRSAVAMSPRPSPSRSATTIP